MVVVVQSLLLLVEDANDNPPVFLQPQTSVTVKAWTTADHLPDILN